ncbi:hypothetical protein [Dactylosporangium sp. NPDC048998]|uniref:hypothetical protein n=1 Tax=Dactylosporangium sp. NPDC048998 TaxID=3363976 RepID=UPI00371F85E2
MSAVHPDPPAGCIAAGLAAVLHGVDIAAAARSGVAVLPAGELPAAVAVRPHPLASLEGLALVRFPVDLGGAGLVGRAAGALAELRHGVLARLLELAVDRLRGRRFGGVPLIDQQLVRGAVADVAAVLATTASPLPPDASAGVVADRHERLTTAGWTVIRFFGAEGYLTDHPARALHVSTLVADVWIGPAS